MAICFDKFNLKHHGRTPREEKAFTARPKIQSHSQIFRYGRSIFCLPHWPNFSDFFDLCLLWVSVVRAWKHKKQGVPYSSKDIDSKIFLSMETKKNRGCLILVKILTVKSSFPYKQKEHRFSIGMLDSIKSLKVNSVL